MVPEQILVGAIRNVDIVVASQNPTRNVNTECAVGGVVKAVFVELWILGTDQTISSTVVSLEKIPSDGNMQTFAQSIDLHNYPNKNNIFKMSQGLVGDNSANPTPFFREWIAIPKGKQRMSLGDKIQLNISAITDDVDFCGLTIYKEYT